MKTEGKCIEYVQYIALLELDKKSSFEVEVGEHTDCTREKVLPYDMLAK